MEVSNPTGPDLVERAAGLFAPPEASEPEQHEEDLPEGADDPVEEDVVVEDGLEEEFEDEDETEEVLHEVKVDGEVKQVTTDELKSRYELSEASYARMQEASKLRKEAEADAQQYRESRDKYSEGLIALQEYLNMVQAPSEEEWDALYAENPREYEKARSEWRAHEQAIARTKQEAQAIAEQRQAEEQRQYAEHLKLEEQRLLESNPEWKDQEVRAQAVQELGSHAKSVLGFTDEELQTVEDHRLVRLLQDSLELHRLKSQTPEPRKPRRRSGSPGGRRTEVPAEKKAVRELRQKLKDTGSDDAAIALASRLFNKE